MLGDTNAAIVRTFIPIYKFVKQSGVSWFNEFTTTIKLDFVIRGRLLDEQEKQMYIIDNKISLELTCVALHVSKECVLFHRVMEVALAEARARYNAKSNMMSHMLPSDTLDKTGYYGRHGATIVCMVRRGFNGAEVSINVPGDPDAAQWRLKNKSTRKQCFTAAPTVSP